MQGTAIKVGSGESARYAQATVNVDPATGLPPAGAGDASEATLQLILTEIGDTNTLLGTTVDTLAETPLMAASDLTGHNVSRTGAGETSMVAAVASQTTRVHAYAVTVPGAGTVEIRSGASGTVLRKHIFPAAGGLERNHRERPYGKTGANTALMFYWSGSGEAHIDFDYVTSA